jgi:hypothetical protein
LASFAKSELILWLYCDADRNEEFMIKELKAVKKKYEQLQRTSEYVDIGQVVNDLYYLIQDQRLKRIPRDER